MTDKSTTEKTEKLGFDDAGALFEKVGGVAKKFSDEYGAATQPQDVEFGKIVEYSRSLYSTTVDFLKSAGAEIKLDSAEVGAFMRKTTEAMNNFLTLDTDGDGGNGERKLPARLGELNDAVFGAAIDLVSDAGDEEKKEEKKEDKKAAVAAPMAADVSKATHSLTDTMAGNEHVVMKPGQATSFPNTATGLNQAMGNIADTLLGQVAG